VIKSNYIYLLLVIGTLSPSGTHDVVGSISSQGTLVDKDSFTQRGVYGYSDRDVWSLDTHIFKILSGGLIKLADTTQGYPCPYPTDAHPPTQSTSCTCAYRWDSDLREYAALFYKLAEDSFEGDDVVKEEEAAYQKAMECIKENFKRMKHEVNEIENNS